MVIRYRVSEGVCVWLFMWDGWNKDKIVSLFGRFREDFWWREWNDGVEEVRVRCIVND